MHTLESTRIRKIWIKAFWGFNVSAYGYLGFTRESDRERFVSEATEDDLVLIYGADSEETELENRRQALGFLQIEPRRILDQERLSEEGRQRKITNGWQDRWTYAVPVKRAWEVARKIEIKHLAPVTYNHANARVIASQGRAVTAEEVLTILQLPVFPVNVFGVPPVTEGEAQPKEIAIGKIFSPSAGIPPTFGGRTSNYQDGEHYLYLLVFEGNLSAFLGKRHTVTNRHALVKVGYSNDPNSRCTQINCGFPPDIDSRWKISLKSKAFANGNAAKSAEDELKRHFDTHFKSLGGEFFLGKIEEIEAAFSKAAAETAFIIKV